MEKPPSATAAVRSRGRGLLRFLPKATSFSVPGTPYSPARQRERVRRAFSGPLPASMVPREARLRRANDAPEPTSPRVTCVGRIRSRRDARRAGKAATAPSSTAGKKGMLSWFVTVVGGWVLFGRRERRSRRREEGEVEAKGEPESPAAAATPPPTPPLGQMRRFASGRRGLQGFEWGPCRDAEEESEEEEEEGEERLAMPQPAPAPAAEPRKEVNLWKRRSVAPLGPLQLR